MSQSSYNLHKVNHANTASLLCLITELEDSLLPEYLPLVSNINRILEENWLFLVVDQIRGRCYFGKKIITIPLWAIKKSREYTIYYIAHEVAHALGNMDHDANFMRDFIHLCPPALQHFEIKYKPKAAMAAGIMPEDF